MLAINISTPTSVLDQLKSNYKQKRLQYSLTQGLVLAVSKGLNQLGKYRSNPYLKSLWYWNV